MAEPDKKDDIVEGIPLDEADLIEVKPSGLGLVDDHKLEKEIEGAVGNIIVPEEPDSVSSSIQGTIAIEVKDMTEEVVEVPEGCPEELEGVKLKWLLLPFDQLRKKFTPPLNPSFRVKSGNENGEEMIKAKMNGKKVSTFALTDKSTKGVNQDAYLVADELQLIVDGMGGAAGGEVASNIACFITLRALEKNPNISSEELLIRIDKATQYVASKFPKLKKMGTVLMATTQPEPNKVEFTYGGDCRGIVVRNGEVVFTTTPQDGILQLQEFFKGREKMKELPTIEETKILFEKYVGSSKEEFEKLWRKFRVESTTNAACAEYEEVVEKDGTKKEVLVADKIIKPVTESFDELQSGDFVIWYTDGIDNNQTPEQVAKAIEEVYTQAKQSGATDEDALKDAIKYVYKSAEEYTRNPEGKFDNIGIGGYRTE